MSLKGRLKKKAGALKSRASAAATQVGRGILGSAKKVGSAVQQGAKAVGTQVQKQALGFVNSSPLGGLLGGDRFGGGEDGSSGGLRSAAANSLRRVKRQAGAGQISFQTKDQDPV